jgi:hypothetical protein
MNQLGPTPRIIEMMYPAVPSQAKDQSPPDLLRQELFRSPLISVLYERILSPIWNMGLRIGGPDAEYASAADFL